MSNMFSEAGGSLEDYGAEFGESLMQPFGDVNPDAMHNQFSVPKFGPGYMAGGGAGILGPGPGEPGWTGFGPGPYTDNYTGVGDRAYWGPLKSQSIASTSTGSVPDLAPEPPAPPSAQWEDPSTASQGTSVAAAADQIHPEWAQDFDGSSVDINAPLPSEGSASVSNLDPAGSMGFESASQTSSVAAGSLAQGMGGGGGSVAQGGASGSESFSYTVSDYTHPSGSGGTSESAAGVRAAISETAVSLDDRSIL